MHRLANGIIAPIREGNIAHPTTNLGTWATLFDLAGRFNEIDGVVVVLFNSGSYRKNIGVKNDVGATRHRVVEAAALGSVLTLLAADLLGLRGGAVVAIALSAALAHGVRWLLWRPWKTRAAPLVWVLHLAYAWIPLHLGLRAAAEMGWVPGSAAAHALTVGAVGGLIIGMMTRIARGHTARPLVADRFDATCYALVSTAAVVRVVLPLAAPAWAMAAVLGSAALWSAGFALYALRYWPVLTRPRLDGKPG